MKHSVTDLLNRFNSISSFHDISDWDINNGNLAPIHIIVQSEKNVNAFLDTFKALASIYSLEITYMYFSDISQGDISKIKNEYKKTIFFIFTEDLQICKRIYSGDSKGSTNSLVLSEIENIINRIKNINEDPYILLTTLPSEYFPVGGIQSVKNKESIELSLLKANQEIIIHFADEAKIYVFDYHRFSTTLTREFFDNQIWDNIPPQNHKKYLHNLLHPAKWLLHFIYPLIFQRIKAFALDLDDTLWNGTVAEIGIDEIKMDFSNVGYPHRRLQHHLDTFNEQGILIGFITRNDPENINSIIENLTESSELKITPSLIKASNYEEKSALIKLMCESFNNISPSSVVFIDNSDIEREAVRNSDQNIIVAPFPYEISIFEEMFLDLPFIEKININNADLERKIWYKEKKKHQLSFLVNPIINPENTEQVDRITELINKTNQFNFTTQRYTSEEVIDLSRSDRYDLIAFEAIPNYQSEILSSIFNVILIDKNDSENWNIMNFIMSCRYLGLKLDLKVFNLIIKRAKGENVKYITGTYIQTERNILVKNWFLNNNFSLINEYDNESIYRALVEDLIKHNEKVDRLSELSKFLFSKKIEKQSVQIKSRIREKDNAVELYIRDGILKAGIDKETSDLISKAFGIIPSVELNQGTHKINSFWIDKYCISNKQYIHFIQSEFSKNERIKLIDKIKVGQKSFIIKYDMNGDVTMLNESELLLPVIVPHEYAILYANFVGGRLPTEYEWERAARGNDERFFPWGNEFPNHNNSWINNEMSGPVNYLDTITSPFGLVGMVGNVWQWCSGYFREHQQYRGSDFTFDSAYWKRVTLRPLEAAEHCGNIVGFRIVRDI